MADAETGEPVSSELTWSPAKRIGVSLLILFHLFALVISPLAVVEPRTELSNLLRGSVQPYLQAMFLDHGYRFFAPEPGPTHFVEYEITDRQGQVIEGHFPDRDRIWPRLLYHRWFMLSESINMHAAMVLDEPALRRWGEDVQRQADRLRDEGNLRRAEVVLREYRQQLADHQMIVEMVEHLAADLGRVLLEKHDGRVIRMKLVTRILPSPFEVLDGYRLNDPRFTPEELEFDLGVQGQGRESLDDPGSPRGERANQDSQSGPDSRAGSVTQPTSEDASN